MNEQSQPDNPVSVALLRLADGTLIDPLTREPIVSEPLVEKRTREEELAEIEDIDSDELTIAPLGRQSIMDLPLAPQQMAFVNNVLLYTLFGLPDDEIAMACNCSVDHVTGARDTDAYTVMHRALVEGLRRSYVSTVHGMLQDSSVLAAKTLKHTLKKSKSGELRFQAAKDTLDRTGHRAADRVEHIHSIEQRDELIIRVLRDVDQIDVPTIDITPVEKSSA